jgi:hypothetical protein
MAHKIVCFISLLFSLQIVNAQQKEKQDTIRLLLVGNSLVYYNNLAQMIGLITDSSTTKIIARKSTVGAATFSEHWLSKRGLKTKDIITTNKFDAIALQDNSMAAIESKDSMFYYGNLLSQLVKKKNAKLLFYNTFVNDTTPSKQPIVDAAYTELAVRNDGTVVPIGPCFTRAKELNPKISLHYKDHRHPSELGSFLAALAFIKTLNGTLPKGYPTVYNYLDKDGESFRIMQLTEEEIKFCVRVVNDVIPTRIRTTNHD